MLSGSLTRNLAFRFLLGAASTSRPRRAEVAILEEEHRRFGDLLLMANALDGGGVHKDCSCIEKTHDWFVHALREWPSARWYGKTEDDTYVNVPQLLSDLQRKSLLRHQHVVYGLIHLTATAPIRPEGLATDACWLGDLESVYAGNAIGWKPAHAEDRVKAHASQAAHCRGTVAPFPTGPLAVFSAALARRLFEECGYLRAFNRVARKWDRASDACRAGHTDLTKGYASATCDGVMGGWLEQCTPPAEGVVLAHMSWSKGHWYADKPGGMGWVLPGPASVAVHGLKASPAVGADGKPKGPGLADWARVHNLSADARATAFPPLLWRYAPARTVADEYGTPRVWPGAGPATSLAASLAANVATCGRDPRSCTRGGNWSLLQPELHRYYKLTCAESTIPIVRRAEAGLRPTKGPSPSSRRDTSINAVKDYFGGNPQTWQYYGCHPARWFPEPKYELSEEERRRRL